MSTTSAIVPGAIWRPSKNAETTYPRHVVGLDARSSRPERHRVEFRRVLDDGSLGTLQSSFVSGWDGWVRKFGATCDSAQSSKVPTVELRTRFAIHIRGSNGQLLTNPVTGSFFQDGIVRYDTVEEAQAKLEKLITIGQSQNEAYPHLAPRPVDLEVVEVRSLLQPVAAAA